MVTSRPQLQMAARVPTELNDETRIYRAVAMPFESWNAQ